MGADHLEKTETTRFNKP